MRTTVQGQHKNVLKRLPIGPALALGALGVVYGDIGTSPLYAVNAVFFGDAATPVTDANVFGIISLIFWLLTLVVTFKYIIFVLRANYQGEGGTLALHELIAKIKHRGSSIMLLLLVFAATLLIGDGMITPSISVLSAVEGLSVATSFFEPYTVPIAMAVLTGLFLVQRKGTHRIGKVFGPIMIVWFLVIGGLGLAHVVQNPEILAALNPLYGIEFIGRVGIFNFLLALGAIILVVTGAEDLYVDLGHFGKKPIRQGWFYLAYWTLVLNYLGQGAFLLSGQALASENIFFSMLPHITLDANFAASLSPWLMELIFNAPIYAMVFLATIATVIASQALISGAFSLVSQAMALDMIPRLNIVHTSSRHKGQIYVPSINWILLAGCLTLVFLFGSSDHLAAAYGLAISGVMISTSTAMLQIARQKWNWGRIPTVLVFGTFFVMDATLLTATSLKFFHGGYIPILIAVVIFAVILAWEWGRDLVRGAYSAYIARASHRDMEWLVGVKKRLRYERHHTEEARKREYVELDRAVVFLVSKPIKSLSDNIPLILRIFIKRHGALPRHIIILTISQEKKPFVSKDKRIEVVDFDYNILSVTAHFGFMQSPNGIDIIRTLKEEGHVGRSLHRYSVEAAEEEMFISREARFIDKLRLQVYFFFKRISPEAYHYFRLDTKPGLSKTVVPIVLNKNGWRIEIPEFAFEASEEHIDPDTRKPTEIVFDRTSVDY